MCFSVCCLTQLLIRTLAFSGALEVQFLQEHAVSPSCRFEEGRFDWHGLFAEETIRNAEYDARLRSCESCPEP
jgi:hypothetical protein